MLALAAYLALMTWAVVRVSDLTGRAHEQFRTEEWRLAQHCARNPCDPSLPSAALQGVLR